MRNLSLSLGALLALSLLISSCEFRSRRAAWRFDPGVVSKLHYAAELRAKADGSWGSSPYVSSAEAEFTLQSSGDTSKGQFDLSLTVDTLIYRSSERGPDEDRYMTGRLRKYRAKVSLSRTGQVLTMEEEPGMPPVEFSPLNFGRFLAYAMPSFPDAAIKKGSRWEIIQPLLDKFHPDSKVIKRFTLSAIRETPQGDLATLLVEMEAHLSEDLGEAEGTAQPAMKGSGQMVFNLSKGRPVSADLELEGRFISRLPQKTGDSTQPEPLPLRLQEKLSLRFPD